ncbi:MAG: T9SS C-terminal target domain-containing protein, partial [Ignavibacteriales bacterium]
RYISAGGIYNSSSEPTNEIHSFNFKNFVWSSEGDTLPRKTIYSRLTLYNDNIYKIGGSDQTNTLLNNVYYSETGFGQTGFNWNEATSIPSDGVADGALTLVLKPDEIECGEIIYVGGFRNVDFRVQVDSVWVGCINPDDPSIIKWESRSNFPGGSRARFQAFPWGQNKVMVIGGAAGEDFNNLFKDVWLYDVVEDSWTQLDDFPIEICAYMGGSIQLTDNLWAAVIAGGITTGQVISSKTFVYFETLETVTSVEIINDRVPNSYFLMQNYPNPFNPSTTIQFALPKESYTKLEIFNALGEKVSTLVSETLFAGTYEYEWNAAKLPSGVYFYRLTLENYLQTKKLLLMK